MEKKQHQTDTPRQQEGNQQESGRPGQELPPNPATLNKAGHQKKGEQHSESSLPRGNETLGTP